MSSKEANVLHSQLPPSLQKAVDLAQEKGASICSQLSPSRIMALHCIGPPSTMPWPCDMDGPPSNFPSKCRKHEREKKRAYDQRICEVEHSSFSPLIFSATGGMGREATCFYKRLASMLAHKWDQAYSTTLWWLRCRLNFSLIRSAIQALHGARSSQGHAVHFPASVDLVIMESRIAPDS